MLRLETDGGVLWSRALGGPGPQVANDVDLHGDGRVIVVGSANRGGDYAGLIACLSADGEVIWQVDFGDAEAWDALNGIVVVDDAILAVGRTYLETGTSQAWLIKVSMDGGLIWSATTAAEPGMEGNALAVLDDGSIAVTGTIEAPDGTTDMVVVKFNEEGEYLWHTVHGGASDEVGRDIMVANGELVAVGYTSSFAPKRQMFMVRMQMDGEVINEGTITSSGNDWEAFGMVMRTDGTFAIAGYTKEYGAGGSDFSLLFANPDGSFIGGPTYGGASNEVAHTLDLTEDGGYYVAGMTESYGPGAMAIFVVRSNGDTLNGAVIQTVDDVGVDSHQWPSKVVASPNPVQSGGWIRISGIAATTGRMEILDACGRLHGELRSHGEQVQLPTLASGLYLLRFHDKREWVAPRGLTIMVE
ncbi:MAG: hypothetical protein IPJ85_13415 [Flavobacteriales bacterium]|nr:hypothetical protein [Flavobacteriales bacterium]